MTSLPPEPGAVLTALRRLPRGAASPAAVLHLATPVRVAVGVEARTDGSWFTVRTHSVAALETGVVEAARAASAAACAAHLPHDRYLDLTGDPAAWVKVLRSGFRQVVFGADLLFGAPLTTVEDGVSDQDVAAWVRPWADGTGCPVPLVLPGAAIADGSAARVVLRRPDRSPVEPQVVRAGPRALDRLAAKAVHRIGADIGGHATSHELVGSRFPGAADYTARVALPGWEAQFPVTVTSATQLAGVPASELAPVPAAVPEGLPAGFTVAGELASAEALVARHVPSGLLMVVRRTADRS